MRERRGVDLGGVGSREIWKEWRKGNSEWNILCEKKISIFDTQNEHGLIVQRGRSMRK